MRIATWNVNSIRTRVDRVVDWMVREDVDVLAMQEIKCKPEQFPAEAFEAAGYELAIHGFNQWNGVAIASRSPIHDVETTFPGMPGFLKGHEGPDLPKEARAMGATVDGVRLWSLYVPNGRSLDDPHYTYKLDWLAALTEYTRAETSAHPEVAVRAHGRFQHRPVRHRQRRPDRHRRADDARLARRARGVLRARAGRASPTSRAPACPRASSPTGTTSSCGSRATRACASTSSSARTAFADAVTDASIHRNERKGAAPSDHVPVLVDLDLGGDDDDDLPMIFG